MKKIIFSVILALILLLVPSRVMAKDYSIKSANIDVVINKDGSADVTETRIYNFDGSFSWADQWIPLKDHKISDIKVTGSDSFSASEESDKVYIKWYYTGVDEEKTFTLTYIIQDAVTNHADISEFYWQLIGDAWTKTTGEVTAKVHLAYPVPNDQVWAFGHGPLNGKIDIVSNTEVDFSAQSLPSNKFFEVRILFPTNPTFVNAGKGNETLSSILAEEKGFGTKTKNKSIAILLLGILAAIFVIYRTIVWVVRWYKIGRDEALPEVNLAGSLHEPPSDLAPPYVEVLLKGGATGKSIVATILELTRRKILAIEFVKNGKKVFLGTRDQYFLVLKKENYKKETTKMEKDLIGFLFSQEPLRLDFDDIKNMGKNYPISASSFWRGWISDSSDGLKKMGFYEKDSLDMQRKAILETVLLI